VYRNNNDNIHFNLNGSETKCKTDTLISFYRHLSVASHNEYDGTQYVFVTISVVIAVIKIVPLFINLRQRYQQCVIGRGRTSQISAIRHT